MVWHAHKNDYKYAMIAIIINQCCCHQIFYIGYFIDNCQPSGTEPTPTTPQPTTPQPTTINGNGLGAGAKAGIIIGSIAMIAAAIIVAVIIIILCQYRRKCKNDNVVPCTQRNKRKSN